MPIYETGIRRTGFIRTIVARHEYCSDYRAIELFLKGRIIQRVEILMHRVWCIFGLDLSEISIHLSQGVLALGISLYQASIDGKALATHQSIFDTLRNALLKHAAQEVAVAKPSVPVLGKGRMIRHEVRQIEPAKLPIRKVEMHIIAEPTLRPDSHHIPNKQHPDHQLGINRRTTCVTVEVPQVATDAAQIEKPINRTQKVTLRDIIVQRELKNSVACASCLGSIIAIHLPKYKK